MPRGEPLKFVRGKIQREAGQVGVIERQEVPSNLLWNVSVGNATFQDGFLILMFAI